MKSKEIFDYRDYRKYLIETLRSRPKQGHGEKSKMASAIQCHNAYFSQILQGKADLSPEQAFLLARYLRLSPDENEYWLLLVQYARAGTADLKKYLLAKIEAIESARRTIKNRIQYDKKAISKEDQAKYFSQWYYSVIHLMITTLKGFSTLEALEKALPLKPALIQDAVQFLERIELIQKSGSEYLPGQVNIHLENDAAMIAVHHTNWRMQAVRSLERQDPSDLHYSSVMTVYRHDFEKIRKIVLQCIDEVREVVANPDHAAKTKETAVAVFTTDWFTLI